MLVQLIRHIAISRQCCRVTVLMTRNLTFHACCLPLCRGQDEYGELLDTFIQYSANEPGTHVSEVARTMVAIMGAHRPNATYKVRAPAETPPCSGRNTPYLGGCRDKTLVVPLPLIPSQVGPDSAAAPIVGLLPTAIREFIVKYSMYKMVGST